MPVPTRAPAALCASLIVLAALPAHASTADDTVDVAHLMVAYHAAVVDHDGPRLAALFVSEGASWFSVLSDAGLAHVREKSPDAPRLRPGGVAAFVTLVATSKAHLNPEHEDVRIRSDDAVASVTFRFRFLIDGREQNRGLESWQLVRAADGWRIASIVYSSTPAS